MEFIEPRTKLSYRSVNYARMLAFVNLELGDVFVNFLTSFRKYQDPRLNRAQSRSRMITLTAIERENGRERERQQRDSDSAH